MLKFNETVDDILSDFSKKVERLEKLIRRNSDKVTDNTATIRQLQEDNLDLIAASTYAQNTADKIRDLISGEA